MKLPTWLKRLLCNHDNHHTRHGTLRIWTCNKCGRVRTYTEFPAPKLENRGLNIREIMKFDLAISARRIDLKAPGIQGIGREVIGVRAIRAKLPPGMYVNLQDIPVFMTEDKRLFVVAPDNFEERIKVKNLIIDYYEGKWDSVQSVLSYLML